MSAQAAAVLEAEEVQAAQARGSTIDPWTLSTSKGYTNADAIRANLIPCETDPHRGGLSRTIDRFHGVAQMTVGSFKGNRRHVCEECAEKWHRHQAREGGVRW